MRRAWPLLLISCLWCAASAAVDDEPTAKSELAAQAVTWRATASVRDGKEAPEAIVQSIVRVVDGDHVVWKRDGKSFAASTIALDPSTEPRSIDVMPDAPGMDGVRVLGIYKIEGDLLTICMADKDRPRPAEFKAEPKSGQTVMTFKKAAR